jgi:hypothetical protein
MADERERQMAIDAADGATRGADRRTDSLEPGAGSALADILREIGLSVLDPSCGTGSVVVEILKRRLGTLRIVVAPGPALERLTLVALESLYAIDIDRCGLAIARLRMMDVVADHFDLVRHRPTPETRIAVRHIVRDNIVCGDFVRDGDAIRREWARQQPRAATLRLPFWMT